MSFITEFPYTNPANYTFDSSKIEVDGEASLKLIDNPGQVFAEDFDDDTGFTYDNTKAEFTGGLVRQKDVTPTDSVFYGNLQAKDLNWRKSIGSLTGTLRGAPSFSGSGMVCTGSQGVSWAGESKADETLVVKYVPNYTGAPPVNINIIGTSGASSPNDDRFHLTHSPSGDNFRITVRDNLGNLLVNAGTIGASAINLQSGTTYFLAVVLDSTAKRVRLYIKIGAGPWTLHGAYSSALGTWSRGGISLNYVVGADSAVYDRSEATFLEFSNYDAALVPTTTAITSPLPNYIYLENKVDGPNFLYTGVGSIQSVDDGSVTESGAPRYLVAGYYWDGAAWSVSDGSYAQANDFATILANLDEFTASGGIVPWSVVFGDSNSLSSVDAFSIEVTGQIYPTDNPTIEFNTSIYVDKIIDVVATTLPDPFSGSDEIKYVVKVDSVYYYISGGVPTVTDGSTYAESNTIDEWGAIWATWDPAAGVFIKIKAFLHSDDGSTTPQLDNLSVEYDNRGTPEDSLEYCNVYGYSKNPDGSADTNTITVELTQANVKYKNNLNIISEEYIVTPESDGYWEILLVENENMDGDAQYKFTISGVVYVRTVPNSATEEFWDLAE